MSDEIRSKAEGARAAALQLSNASEEERNAALEAIARGLEANAGAILEANRRDLDAGGRPAGRRQVDGGAGRTAESG